MAYPFSALPSVRSFVESACAQGCKLKTVTISNRQRGAVESRYLIAADGKRFVILPTSDDERLTPTMLENWVRALKVEGYDHSYIDDNVHFTYHLEDRSDA